jgi:hypothetical protein
MESNSGPTRGKENRTRDVSYAHPHRIHHNKGVEGKRNYDCNSSFHPTKIIIKSQRLKKVPI